MSLSKPKNLDNNPLNRVLNGKKYPIQGMGMKSLEPTFLRQILLSQQQASRLRVLGEHRVKQALYQSQASEALEALRAVARVESLESSNRMDGIEVPRKRIREIALQDRSPLSRSEQKIAGYRDALHWLHESTVRLGYSVEVIQQFHSQVNRYLPFSGGRWKMSPNNLVDRDRQGNVVRVRFETVPPAQVPQAMDELTRQYQAAMADPENEPLILLPLTLLDFLCIRPFSDGNGRVARLLALLLLDHLGHPVGRTISLERIIESSRESYHEALHRSTRGWHEGEHDVMPWVSYFWGVLIRAYRELEERVGSRRSGRGKKAEFVLQAVLRRQGPFAISDIEHDCPGVTRDWIRLILRQLRDAGRIESQGQGRGARWVHKSAP